MQVGFSEDIPEQTCKTDTFSHFFDFAACLSTVGLCEIGIEWSLTLICLLL